ncbi:uncharacterized protein LOC103507441 [Diaphorina citri]|uniref:Uncharacterized protein LOC103507441 n=1 Tax=Diaphorina citri TaxID=121845 RepID=A0A1S3CZ99_DIACI|nr:uncharacterized protein LOC103507441 [Diaphorina citri]KAI5705074.1 hypothetical protein M8J75_011615 [Diaphorina citri]KAI5743170.1 hypothetical protein M8J77_015248 [Diaphorina citri]
MSANCNAEALRKCCPCRTLNRKEKIVCTVIGVLSHFLFGSLLQYPPDFRTRFLYPNLGSTLFVLSIQLYLRHTNLLPRDLCFDNYYGWIGYNIVMSILLSNIALVLVYQVINNILLEAVSLSYHALKYLNLPYSAFDAWMACVLSYVLYVGLFLWVLVNWSPCKKCHPKPTSRKYDVRPPEKRKGYLKSDKY